MTSGNIYSQQDDKGNTTVYAPSLGQYADNPLGALNSQTSQAQRQDIATINKDFKFPQTFRANLAL